VGVAHRLYYDQLDLMTQLGLAEPSTEAAGVPQPRAAAEAAAEQPAAG
jgi:hypothetical protein